MEYQRVGTETKNKYKKKNKVSAFSGFRKRTPGVNFDSMEKLRKILRMLLIYF